MDFTTEKDWNSYPAVKVVNAVYSVFRDAGDEGYAKEKTKIFLNRCRINIHKPKEQPVNIKVIKEIVYAMLDADSEKTFWLRLNS